MSFGRFQRIHIELTNRCNFSCVFCPNSLMTRPLQDLSVGLVRKALEEISREKLTDAIFLHVMGEATLYPHLEEVVEECKRLKLKAALTTNGWGLSGSRLEAILGAGIGHIFFSVQTPEGDSFALRKAPVDFSTYKKKICSSIARILEHGSAKVTLSFLTTPLPFFLLPSKKYRIVSRKKDLVRLFKDWLNDIASEIQCKAFREKLHSKESLLLRHLSSFHMLGWNKLNVTEKFSLETRVLGDWVHRGLSGERISRARVGYCEGLKTHFGILSNGDFVFCCVDYNGKTSFGNLEQVTIKEALAQKRIKDVILGFERLRVKEDYCQRCLGDISFDKSMIRQLGSILYFKIYRRWWEKERGKINNLLCN